MYVLHILKTKSAHRFETCTKLREKKQLHLLSATYFYMLVSHGALQKNRYFLGPHSIYKMYTTQYRFISSTVISLILLFLILGQVLSTSGSFK